MGAQINMLKHWQSFNFNLYILCIICIIKGIARTQSPTNKNYALELPTFGVIVGVSPTGVQWRGLALEEPPSWSRLTSVPGKYARDYWHCQEHCFWITDKFGDNAKKICCNSLIVENIWTIYTNSKSLMLAKLTFPSKSRPNYRVT